eukprot:565999-Pyramimonas_sp.AAC.1
MDPEGPNNDCWSVTTSGRYIYEGYLCGTDPSFSDSVKSPSGAAEFQAALWLVLWLLQAEQRFRDLPIEVFTDNILVVATAAGGTRYGSCGEFPRIFDGTLKLLRQNTRLVWKHVLGHNANPLNELADTIARLASMGIAPTIADDFQP